MPICHSEPVEGRCISAMPERRLWFDKLTMTAPRAHPLLERRLWFDKLTMTGLRVAPHMQRGRFSGMPVRRGKRVGVSTVFRTTAIRRPPASSRVM